MKTATPNLSATLALLKKCPGVTIGRAYLLTIGRETYPAVRYSERVTIGEGCPAYDRGEREYVREAFYVLAEKLPPSYRHNPGSMGSMGLRFRFNVERDADAAGACSGAWYVSGHLERESADALRPDQKRFHPRDAQGNALPHFVLHLETLPSLGARRVVVGRALGI